MKIAYNPTTSAALTAAPSNNDITFDLSGLSIYARGIKFKGTDTTYSVFKKHTSTSGGGYTGLVPIPSYTTTSIRYLREDGSWVVPYSVFTGATSSAAGTTGLVPAPAAGKQNYFLRGDSTWAIPTTYSAGNYLTLSGTTFNHNTSGVTAGTYGPTANATLSHSGTFVVPNYKVDAYGHITAGGYITYTLPADNNTTYSVATNTYLGLIKPWYNHTAASTGPTAGSDATAVAVNAISTTAGRYYALEMDSNGRGFVNVPWVNTVYTHPTQNAISVTNANGLVISGIVVNTLGHVTGVTTKTLAAADIPSLSYLPLAGGTMTGALNFKNATWNLVGDDVYIGDCNIAGGLGLKGANGQTNLVFYNYSNTSYYTRLITQNVASNLAVYLPTASGTLALTSDIPTSLKNPNALTIQANGTTLVTYDGSSALTANLTYSNVGAAAASHTHDYLPLAGGTMTGTITFANLTGSNVRNILYGLIADNDYFRLQVGGTASNSGYVELATADDGSEPIYIRLYTGVFTAVKRTATILDANGNTSFPGTVTASSFTGSLSGNASTATALTTDAGSATLPIYFSGGKPVACTASSVFGGLGNSGTALSITIAGYNRTLTVAYASSAGSATTAQRLSGGTLGTWGTLTSANGYSLISAYDYGDNGAYTWVGKSGQMSMQVDGYFYQNEGAYKVLDTSMVSNKSATLTRGSAVTVATVGGTNINVTLPNDFVIYSKVTLATANGTNLAPQILNIEGETFDSTYGSYWSVLNLGSYSGGNFRSQIALPYLNSISDTDMFIRTANDSTWRNWRRVLHSGNYNSYSPTLTGSGASGTWGISITGSSASCTGNAASTTSVIVNYHNTNNTKYPLVWSNQVNTSTVTGNLLYKSSNFYINPSTGYLYATVFSGNLAGNASTATTLETTRTINGTNFNGSANITTANWGTARSIYIADSDGTNTGTAVSVNGSANATLKLPSTIKATLTGTSSSSNWLNTNTSLTYGANGLNYFNINGTAGTTANSNVTPTSAWYHILRMNHGNSAGYFADIAIPLNDVGGVWWRQVRGGTNYGWYKILDTNNYTSYCATASHTHSYAGSSSAGGSANSANCVNSSLTVKYNGTLLWTFNGSTALTLNISAGTNVGITKNTSGDLVISATDTTYTFTPNNPTLSFEGTSSIGTIGGKTFNVTMPSNPNTDYKTSSSASTGAKLFLIGATSQGANTSTGVTTYSNAYCYVGTDNCLYSGGSKVLTSYTNTVNTAGSSATDSTIYLVGATSQTTYAQTYSNAKCYASGGYLYSNSTKVDPDAYLLKAGGTLVGGLITQIVRPYANNTYDLGTSSYKYKNGYFSGTLVANNLLLTATSGTILNTNGVECFAANSDSTVVGYGTSVKSLSTYIDGYNIYLRTGTAHTTQMTISSGGGVSIAKDLNVSSYAGIGGVLYLYNGVDFVGEHAETGTVRTSIVRSYTGDDSDIDHTLTLPNSDGTLIAADGSVGTFTKGVFFNGNQLSAMTYSLNATVNSGYVDRLAYYSSATTISLYSSTTGAANVPIYLNAGVPTAIINIEWTYTSYATSSSSTYKYYSSNKSVKCFTFGRITILYGWVYIASGSGSSTSLGYISSSAPYCSTTLYSHIVHVGSSEKNRGVILQFSGRTLSVYDIYSQDSSTPYSFSFIWFT